MTDTAAGPAPGATRVWAPGDGVDTVVVITAHPDDVDFGCAGTIAAFTDAGVAVTYCIVTNGDAGGSDRSVSRADMAALRQEEQTKAAAELGVTDLIFLGYPDGRVEASFDLRRDLSRVIRQVRPQRVITQSPERRWDSVYASHPDHLAAGEAALCAVYPDARNPFAHPELLEDEGLEPHSVDEVWLMAVSDSTIVVDTTQLIERKLAALRSHASQVGDGEHLVELLTGWNGGVARAAGLPEGSLAESYRIFATQ